jgi:arsenate reductase
MNLLYPELENFIKSLEIETFTADRKERLDKMIDLMLPALKAEESIHINFICTHNSRRSHLGQFWAQTAAAYAGFSKVFCYSGGTEATAIHPNILKVLEKVGFTKSQLSFEKNAIFSLKYHENAVPILAFSKVFDHPFNPSSQFIAAMTCSEAAENCPFVPGNIAKVMLNYEDPKIADGQANELEIYEARSKQIAAEMHYVFQTLKKAL